jgi:hypothetical protein
MATRKRKKRSTSHPARRAPHAKKAVTTARRRRKHRGLSAAFNKGSAKGAGMSMVKAAGGGLVVNLIEKGASKFLPGTMGKVASIGVTLLGSFLAHTMLKQPDVSSGMAGALGYSLSKNIPGLNDDADFADMDALYDDAPMMDEYGNPMDEDGNYLSEALYDNDNYMSETLYENEGMSGYYDAGGWPQYNG